MSGSGEKDVPLGKTRRLFAAAVSRLRRGLFSANRSGEDSIQPSGSKIGRREALAEVARQGAGFVLFTAGGAGVNIVTDEVTNLIRKNTGDFSLSGITGPVRSTTVSPPFSENATRDNPPVKAAEARPVSADSPFAKFREKLETVIPQELDLTLQDYERAYEKYAKRLDELVRLSEADPQLEAEYSKFFGAFDMDIGDILPFRMSLMQAQRDMKSTIASLDRLTALPSDSPEYTKSLKALIGATESTTRVFSQLTGQEAKEATGEQGVAISADPAIALTDQGRLNLVADEQKIRVWLESGSGTIPALKITLTSKDRYGERVNPKSDSVGDGIYLGDYQQKINPATNLVYGILAVDMDSRSPYGDSAGEISLRHEGLGHGTFSYYSILANSPFLNQLEPQEVIDRLTLEMKVLNDPVWGAHFTGIPGMFNPEARHLADISGILEGQGPVNQEAYQAIVRGYPLMSLLSPFRDIIQSKNVEGKDVRVVKLISMIDNIANASRDSRESLRIRFAPIPRLSDSKKEYQTFASFFADYRPLLVEASEAGSVRARILLAGFEAFGENFEHYRGLPTKASDSRESSTISVLTPETYKDANSWQNYANLFLANAIMFHLMLKGEIGGVDYRTLFQEEERQNAGTLTKIRVLESVMEFWAENVAYGSKLGDRLPDNPYVSALAA